MPSQHATHKLPTAYTMSVDYNVGTTTGISAGDRAATIQRSNRPRSQTRGLLAPRTPASLCSTILAAFWLAPAIPRPS